MRCCQPHAPSCALLVPLNLLPMSPSFPLLTLYPSDPSPLLQARAQDPDAAQSVGDKTEEALAYLHAGGGAGWNMQLAVTRTMSTDASGVLQSVGSHMAGMGSLLAGEMLLENASGSYHTGGGLGASVTRGSQAGHANGGGGSHFGPAGRGAAGGMGRGDMYTATREMNSLNRRAAALLETQAACERAAEERWRSAAAVSDVWLGSFLETVEVDDW